MYLTLMEIMQGILVMTTKEYSIQIKEGCSLGVSLYIHGVNLDPMLVSEELGLLPIRSHKKGYSREAPSGKVFVAKAGFWEFSTCAYVSTTEVNDHLEFLAERIYKTKKISDINGVQEAFIGVYVGVDHDAYPTVEFDIKPSTLKKISAMNIPIKFTFA